MSRTGWLLDLREGLTLYEDAWTLQKRLVAARQQGVLADGLILLEHEPVFTVGRSTRTDHLLVPREVLGAHGFRVYDIERGGSVTYHGPGQLVGYPILDLRAYNEDVVKFMRSLEETILRTLAEFGLTTQRVRGYPGAWIGEQKIAAVGVAVKRKVTMHGFALNVDPTLADFAFINPCGIGRSVTSMAQVLGRAITVAEVRSSYVRHFTEVFDLAVEPVSREHLEHVLATVAPPPSSPPARDAITMDHGASHVTTPV
jgi:lipoate-protein ligase B